MTTRTENSVNLRHRQPDILEMLQNLVCDYHVKAAIVPRKISLLQIQPRYVDSSLSRILCRFLEDLDTVRLCPDPFRVFNCSRPVPTTDVEQSKRPLPPSDIADKQSLYYPVQLVQHRSAHAAHARPETSS
jgi:hypothetical protein